MKLKALKRYPIKKGMPVEEQELELAAGVGIVGDCHADGGVRQISLLTTEQKDWMQQQEVKGFCFSKFKENILLETETELQVGDRLQLGEAVIELTENRKVCHEDLCGMAKKDIPCLLSGGCLFAAVLESGVIRMDSPVSLKKQAPSMAEWLKEFAYRIPMHWWIFALSTATILMVALLSTLWQCVRISNTNPSETLNKNL